MSKELSPVYKRLEKDENFVETPISNVTRNINYSEKDEILEIEFRPNFIYQYLNVPLKVWKEYKQTIDAGRSSGSFIDEKKIKTVYNYRKILLNQFQDH